MPSPSTPKRSLFNNNRSTLMQLLHGGATPRTLKFINNKMGETATMSPQAVVNRAGSAGPSAPRKRGVAPRTMNGSQTKSAMRGLFNAAN